MLGMGVQGGGDAELSVQHLADQRDAGAAADQQDAAQGWRGPPGPSAAPGSSPRWSRSAPAGSSVSNSARVTRTVVLSPGRATGTRVSTSVERASLASTQSRRSRASPTVTAGSSGSSAAAPVAERAETCRSTASSKSTPPRCSTPSGCRGCGTRSRSSPARRRRRSRRRGRRRRPGRPVRPESGTRTGWPPPRARCSAGPRSARPSRRPGPAARAGTVPSSPGGSAPPRPAAAHPLGRGRSTTQRSRCAVSACGENGAPADHDRHVVTDPPLELPGQPVRLGQPTPLGRLTDQELPVRLEEQHRRDLQRPVAQTDHRRLGRAVRHRGRGEGRPEVNTQPVVSWRTSRGESRQKLIEPSVAAKVDQYR